jgi:hypothetical protein
VGRAVTLAERGLLRTAPLITHRLPLEAIGEAFDTVAERRDEVIKVVLEVGHPTPCPAAHRHPRPPVEADGEMSKIVAWEP